MEPIRVLQVVFSMDAGGIETMLMNYYRNIDRSKVQFDFLIHCDYKSYYEEEIERMGGKLYHIPSYHPKSLVKHKKALKAFFKEHREYKVVHCHIMFYGLYVLKAAKKAGVPMRIAHAHTASKFYKLNATLPFRVYTRFHFQRQFTHVYACSPEAAEYVAPGKPYIICKNAINVSGLTFSEEIRNAVRSELGVDDGALLLGHVGRFAPEKNHAFILDTFKELLKVRGNSKLLLVGGGKLFDEIKAKAKALDIEDKVIFTGVRKDINRLLCAMDVFVFPSKFEGFGMVAVEAQVTDLPCIISNVVPPSAIITDKVKVMTLEEGAAAWAKELGVTDHKTPRRNNQKLMTEAGLDIKANVEWLQKVYLEAYGYGK